MTQYKAMKTDLFIKFKLKHSTKHFKLTSHTKHIMVTSKGIEGVKIDLTAKREILKVYVHKCPESKNNGFKNELSR